MNKSIFAVIACCIVLASCLPAPKRNIVSKREEAPHGWTLDAKADPRSPISFSVLLKQKNLNTLNEIFEAVSNPKSDKWGQFLTQDEVAQLVKPDQHAFDAVMQWLNALPEQPSLEVRADSIRVRTSVANAERLFKVPFFVFQHEASGKSVIKFLGAASTPASLTEHIDFIAGLSEFFLSDMETTLETNILNLKASAPVLVGPTSKTSRRVSDDPVITPSLLKQFYNVPSGLVGTNSENLQGIAAFSDYFSMGALQSFATDQGFPFPNVTRIGPDCMPSCDQYESDLDVQYMTGMGQGVKTIFLNQPSNYWILQFAEDTEAMTTPPKIFSVSYGWSELEQCAIAVANCQLLGYNSAQYVNRTNTELQKLGTIGVSVLVSDGDDGAPSLGGASGNCPIDISKYCPLGGCQYSNPSCSSFQVFNVSANAYCFFPMGLGSAACTFFLQDPNLNSVLGSFVNANPNCNFAFDQDVSKLPHFYSSCPCTQIQSVSTDGYVVGQYVFNLANGAVFTADYPTSSPYVTSVGATQFIQSGSQITEVGCSILSGAIITTGGGFSSFQPMPTYQVQAVETYVNKYASTLPPSFSFNTAMRAYPDVAFNGHHYKIFYSNDSSDQCPCPATEVDGTSCSSPALSGLLSLINDKLLNSGKSTLGFLNYLLYQMYQDAPTAFNDVTSGNNNCNRAYCCKYGYSAVPGYDVVSGLGSPNFQNMLNYVLSQKGVKLN